MLKIHLALGINSLVLPTGSARNLHQQGIWEFLRHGKALRYLKTVLLASGPNSPSSRKLKAVTLNNFTAHHFGKSSLNLTKITSCSRNIYEPGNPPVSV